MYLEDFERELDDTDVLDYVDHTDGEILDLSDDDGVEIHFKSKSAGTTLPSDFEKEDTDAYNHVTGAAVELLDQSQTHDQLEPAFSAPIEPIKTEMPAAYQPKQKKSVIARAIYAREAAKGPVVRKNIIALFKSEAGLTDAGAATYYAQIHTKE